MKRPPSIPAPPAILAPPAPPSPPATPAPPAPPEARVVPARPAAKARVAEAQVDSMLARPDVIPSTVSRLRGRSPESLARAAVRDAERQRRRYERAEARRFTERARRRRIAWLIGAGVFVLLIVSVLFTAYSPLFAVRQITVAGTTRIDASAVQAALQAEEGRPLALIDYSDIETTLSAFPLIQSYSTQSQLPNTLVVSIVERQPVGVIANGSTFDLVDPAGVLVETAGARPAGLPLIDLGGSELGSPGFLAATAVLRSLPADLLAKVDSVSAATPDSVTLALNGGSQKVIWGDSTDSALKARVLDKLVGTQSADSSLIYDVSSPESPVVS